MRFLRILLVLLAFFAPGAIAADAPFDIQFLDTMSAHHKQGVEMAKLAVQKSRSGDIRTMAQKMVDDQEADISDLSGLHRSMAPQIPETVNRDMPGMKSMDMRKLTLASEEEFDRRFLDMTIQHHKGAISMAEDALKNASQPAVRAKAQEIAAKQASELQELQDIRKRF